MKILFASAPGYGLTLPIVPLVWAARSVGHETLLATTAEMTEAGARAGLGVVDVFPERDVWQELLRTVADHERADADDADSKSNDSPFGLFTQTMTAGTIEAARAFGADLVVYTSDHVTGRLTAQAMDVPALEVGNRISWSMRDVDFRTKHAFGQPEDETIRMLRAELSIPDGEPKLVARIDPRPPSMGGIAADESDFVDGRPWWSMRFVPYNGGAVIPAWALRRPNCPRVCVTIGTVVPLLSGTSNLTAVIEALGRMDVEVILAAGRTDLAALGTLPDNVRSVGFLPLSTFLPTCSVIVHHGGSGTTAAPLHYGVPQLVLPSFADNGMSAQRVVDRGVGLSHDPATAEAAMVRTLVERLLNEPAFGTAAGEVSAEMATQPSPSAVLGRVLDALR